MNKIKLLILCTLTLSSSFANAQIVHVDLNDDDSGMLFDDVMNSGTTYFEPTQTDMIGHYRTDITQLDGTNQVLAYFLSSDQAFRLQCTAITDPFGSSDAKCFVEYDSSKFDPSVSKLSAGPYQNSSLITFISAQDIQAIYDLVSPVQVYATTESIKTTDATGSAVSRPLFQFDCSQPGHITNQPSACRAVFLPRPTSP